MLSLLCNSTIKQSSPLKPAERTPPFSSQTPIFSHINRNLKFSSNLLLHSIATTTLSLNFIFFSPLLPPSIAVETNPSSLSNVEIVEEDCKENDFLNVPADDDKKPVTNEELVEEAWDIVNESFLDEANHGWSPEKWTKVRDKVLSGSIGSRSRAHDIIRRMLASLEDPYTRFLSPSEFSKMAKYDLTGIGINIREVPGEDGVTKLKVLGTILDGPADAAGVRQGDEILSVNGVDVKGKSSFEVSSILQGPRDTFVNIEVKHGKCGPVQSFKIQRQVTARTPVFYRLEQATNPTASIGYIRLKDFNALAKKDLVIAMKNLQNSGASYFILDLRDNLGGLVQAGIEIARLFLNRGDAVIYTVGRDPQFQTSIVAEDAPFVTSPLIVLVNNRTASASEIVASALHDNCRAVLVGERTFGKGLIQSVFELRDGSGVVVTIGKYVTPNHLDINRNGILPEFQRIPAWNEVEKYLSQCQLQRKG